MASYITKLVKVILGGEHINTSCVMMGLDAAGKTTLIYRWKLGELVTTIPTIGFNIETVEYKGFKLNCWDVGGCDKIRPLWRHYFQGVEIIIWVVDSNDRDRINESKEELYRTLSFSEELKDAIVLFIANKQDLPNCMTATEIVDIFGLNSGEFKNTKWYMQPTTATTGKGCFECLDWISIALKEKKSKFYYCYYSGY